MSVIRQAKFRTSLVDRNLDIIHICIDHDLVSLAGIVSVGTYEGNISCLEE